MTIARAVVVTHISGNRAAGILQRDGEVVLTLAADKPLEQITEELTELIQGQVDAGTWTQHWDDPEEPPQLREVS